MEENQVSHMSLLTAYQRGYHAMHDESKVFDDFLAYHFLTEEERALFVQQYTKIINNTFAAMSFPDQATALAWFIQTITSTSDIISRARYTEDNLEEVVKRGVRQYIILGAGMDTFAFRFPDMVKQLQVFEVDHPATQAFKTQRIAKLGWEKPSNLHFVPVDFMKENLETALKRSLYDSEALSFFSWLGVTYYLSRDVVLAMLCAIAGLVPTGSSIIFDYYDTDAFLSEKVAPRVRGWKQYAQQAGEPIITGFDPSTLEVDLASVGLRLHENLSPSEIEGRYFHGRTDNYHATEHTHFAWAVVM